MSRRFALLIFSAVIVAYLATSIIYTQAVFAPMDNISSAEAPESKAQSQARIYKHIFMYGFESGFNVEQVNLIAKFDLAIIGEYQQQEAGVAAAKQINPNLKVIVYYHYAGTTPSEDSEWAEVNSHESWFVHTTDGRRVMRNSSGYTPWYLMNIGDAEYRTWALNTKLMRRMDSVPSNDGVFADDVWVTQYGASDCNTGNWSPWITPLEEPIEVTLIPAEVRESWHSWNVQFLEAIKQKLGAGKIVIPNITINSDDEAKYMDYVKASDGSALEGAWHPSWLALDSWPSWHSTMPQYLRRIDILYKCGEMGKWVLCHDGAEMNLSGTSSDVYQKYLEIMRFSLGCYLLGYSVKGTQTIGYGNWWDDPINRGYYPEMNWDIGNPQGPYQADGAVLTRTFEHATIVVNLDVTASHNVTVNGKSYSVLPHTAEFIWTGTVYIRADGSIDPSTAPIQRKGSLYLLTSDVRANSSGIVIERDGITLDGNAYTVQGLGTFGMGVNLTRRRDVKVENITIRSFSDGIYVNRASNNVISGNNITANRNAGVWIESSLNDVVFGNYIANNNYGISLREVYYNRFYHNDFINNTQQVLDQSTQNPDLNPSINAWNDDYSLGGNYWSDYSGEDKYSGLFQNEICRDGIIDTPHIIDENNRDSYPLLNLWSTHLNPPVPRFIYRPKDPSVDKAIIIDASISYDLDGNIASYAWDFHDGNISTTSDPAIVRTYDAPGEYNTTLTVIDSKDQGQSYSQLVLARMETFVSLSINSTSNAGNFAVELAGQLSDVYEHALRNEIVMLSYRTNRLSDSINKWIQIASEITDDLGNYQFVWTAPTISSCVVKVEWLGNGTHFSARSTTDLNMAVLRAEEQGKPPEERPFFSVVSNSTISDLAFNSASNELSFTISGPSGTTGYVSVYVSKTLAANAEDIKVYLNSTQTDHRVTLSEDAWLLYFTCSHSTHKVIITMSGLSVPFAEMPLGKAVIYGGPIVAVAVVVSLYFLIKRRKPDRRER